MNVNFRQASNEHKMNRPVIQRLLNSTHFRQLVVHCFLNIVFRSKRKIGGPYGTNALHMFLTLDLINGQKICW